MAVYKRGAVYWYEFERGGRRYRDSAHTGNKRAAQDIEAARKMAIAKGDAGIAKRKQAPTLAEFLPRVRDFLAATRADKPATVRFYQQQIAYLLAAPVLPRLALDAITTEHIAGYARWRRQTVTVATTNRALATLRRALRLAAEWQVITRAPSVRLLAGEARREAVLAQERQGDYLAHLRPDIAPVAALMLETGLRPGEAVGLEWGWLRQPAGARWAVVVPAMAAKSHRERTVPLTSGARALVEALPRLDRVRVWPGLTLRALERDHRRACRETGIAGLTVHGLRHTAATRMGDAGMDAFALRDLLGHASLSTTQRYVHPQRQALDQAIERLENVPTISPTVPRKAARRKTEHAKKSFRLFGLAGADARV